MFASLNSQLNSVHMVPPQGLVFSTPPRCFFCLFLFLIFQQILRRSLPKANARAPSISFQASYDVALEILKQLFLHILPVQQVTKARPDIGREELDSTSYWWRVSSTLEKNIWSEKYCYDYTWKLHSLLVECHGFFKNILIIISVLQKSQENSTSYGWFPLFLNF